jgi:hypothetical protein
MDYFVAAILFLTVVQAAPVTVSVYNCIDNYMNFPVKTHRANAQNEALAFDHFSLQTTKFKLSVESYNHRRKLIILFK